MDGNEGKGVVVRYILDIAGDQYITAAKAAKALERDGHKDCIYEFENGTIFYARRNKASISVLEIINGVRHDHPPR